MFAPDVLRLEISFCTELINEYELSLPGVGAGAAGAGSEGVFSAGLVSGRAGGVEVAAGADGVVVVGAVIFVGVVVTASTA